MKIELRIDSPTRRWHRQLAAGLAADGHEVVVRAGARSKMRLSDRLLRLQQIVFGPRPALFDVIEALPEPALSFTPDLVVACDGEVVDTPSLLPLFGGTPGPAALVNLLASNAAPSVSVVLRATGAPDRILVRALLAAEDHRTLSRALDQCLARLVTLLRLAIRRYDQGEDDPLADPPDASVTTPVQTWRNVSRHMIGGFAAKLAGRLPGARLSPNHWRIAYRRLDGAGVGRARGWPHQPYRFLPDQPGRFLADPMLFTDGARTCLFFEDYDYASAKGVIACVDLHDDGSASSPRTVLTCPVHLSYPFVFRHADDIFMMPEMSAARRLQLFRADPFPDHWVPDRVLLEDIVVADATPVWHEGLWWIFATQSDDGGSSWDQLSLFHAPDLFGPWTAHRSNPVLIDAGAARPAGPFWREDGQLMRVAQDCRDGYGRGLTICRVDRLDCEGFAQTIVARLSSPSQVSPSADGVHTLVADGDWEAIDLRFPRHS
jgi:hypothetical protein